MQKVGKFNITGSFKITGRGLVAIGDIIEGSVKVGDITMFNAGTQRVMKRISGVEMGDKISTREYFVGLTFVHKDEEERHAFELMGQEKYLFGVALHLQNYSDRAASTDHDHCEFCTKKLSDSIPDTLKKGYTTADGYRWICEACFADFKEAFEWTV